MSPNSTEESTQTTPTIEAPLVHVDPGQVIRINARFPGSPKKILFSHLPPQTKDAVHDPGFGASGTLIKLDAPDLYYYIVDTRGMCGGLGWWYFYSEDDDYTKRRAKVGKFVVTDVPQALVDRSIQHEVLGAAPSSWWQRLKERRLHGLDVLCGCR